jgi:MinD-like ATPase involved in chromosome partitioning or flagellar assembly
MTREPEVALVLSTEEWVDEFHRYCVDHGGARVRSLVLDPTVALDEDFDVLVAGARWPALTQPFVDALHRRQQRVLVVGDAVGTDHPTRRLGVDGVVGRAATPAELVDAVRALVPAGPVRPGRTGVLPFAARAATDAPEVVAVGGPRGAGATEVALALAAWCTVGGARAVLVDADLDAAALAVRLGLPLEPNLCTAVDAAAAGPDAVPGTLFDLGDDWPVVLVGAPHRRAAAALGPADLAGVVDALAGRYAPVVVDVAAGPGATGTDPDAPDPVAGVLTRARAVVGVGAATPVGVVRLLRWVEAVRTVAPAVPVHVVVNRAPAGRSRRAEVAGEVQRVGRVAGCTFAPADPRVDEAAWAAGLVARGPFARAAAQVGAALRVHLGPGAGPAPAGPRTPGVADG